MNKVNTVVTALDLQAKWKVLVFCMIAGFLMAALPQLGIHF